MTNRFPLGDVARLFLDIITGSTGETAETPVVAIRRRIDGYWFEESSGEWVPSPVNNEMAEKDPVNEQGRYYFDFDQNLDLEAGSRRYTVRYTNTGAAARLSYEEVEFGPLTAAAELELCAITGTVLSMQGRPVANSPVLATLVPVFNDSRGRTVQTDLVKTYTDALGEFTISLVRGATARLEIDSVGYDRKIVVPDEATVIFTDL